MVTADENKAVVGRYFKEFHDGREHAILEEIMTPDLLEGTRQVTRMLLTAFPDYRITIEEQIAEGDKVARLDRERNPRGRMGESCGHHRADGQAGEVDGDHYPALLRRADFGRDSY